MVRQHLAQHRDSASDRRWSDAAETEDQAFCLDWRDREPGDRRDHDAAGRGCSSDRNLGGVTRQMADSVQPAIARSNVEQPTELAMRGLLKCGMAFFVNPAHAADMSSEM